MSRNIDAVSSEPSVVNIPVARSAQARGADNFPRRDRPAFVENAKQEVLPPAPQDHAIGARISWSRPRSTRGKPISPTCPAGQSRSPAVEIAASDYVRKWREPGLTFCRRARRTKRLHGPSWTTSRFSFSVTAVRQSPPSTWLAPIFCRERPDDAYREQRDIAVFSPTPAQRLDRIGRGRKPCNSTVRRQTCP